MTDPRERLEQLGARWSPDFEAYASGALPAHMVRCVLCGTAPCACTYCEVMHENRYYLATGREQFERCGMRIDPATGECPRGHSAATCTTCGDPRGASRGNGCEECAEYLAELDAADGAEGGQR